MSLLELIVGSEYDNTVSLIWDDLQPSPVTWTYSHLKKTATSLACRLRSLLSGCYGNSSTVCSAVFNIHYLLNYRVGLF